MITPIFGGGFNAGEPDPKMPIRPSSIRGHLRFWWRATRGAKYKTVPELRQREGEIWGTTENPSPVEIKVDIESHDEPVECARYEERQGRGGYALRWSKPLDTQSNSLPYALFPFQGASPDSREPKDPSKMIKSAEFRLTVYIPNKERMTILKTEYNDQRRKKGLSQLNDDDKDIRKDIEIAIWAWINFGGIGARTRRGCGALYCTQSTSSELNSSNPDLVPQSLQSFKDWMNKSVTYYEMPLLSTQFEWPTLGRVYLKEGRDSISCWGDCIWVMKNFRQGVEIGRDSGSNRRPGRSRWPEPESIRNLVLKQRALSRRPNRWHQPDRRIPDIGFPRTELGMPIIVEIRGEDIKPTLQPNKDHDRMASPLILRPIKFSNGRFASMIIRLNTPPLKSVYVKPGKKDLVDGYTITASQIKDSRNVNYIASPMSGLCDTGSALDALIAFAKEKRNGFIEVSP